MKCESPRQSLSTHHVRYLYVLRVTRIFAEGNVPARITQAYDIDSKTIAERFESISGTQIYGISNWREWCSLERSLGPNTMQWLSEVCVCKLTNDNLSLYE